MIAVISGNVDLINSNVAPDFANIEEFDANQNYTQGQKCKITQIDPNDDTSYLGFVFQALIDTNKSPLESKDWILINYLSYDENKTYPENATVWMDSKLYISLEANNTTNPLYLDSKWKYLKEANERACLDYYFTTTTTAISEPLIIEVESNPADTLNLFGIVGNNVKIEQLDKNGNLIVTNVIPHSDPASIRDFASYLQFNTVGGILVPDATDYGTQEFNMVDTSSIIDFASYLQFRACNLQRDLKIKLIKAAKQRVRITIYPIAGKAQLSTLVIGNEQFIGCTVYGLEKRRVAIKAPERDKWGDIELGSDDYVTVFSGKLQLNTNKRPVDYIDNLIEQLFNTPAVFYITDDKHKSFNTFGLLQDNGMSLESAVTAKMPLKIESFKYKKQQIC